MNSNMAFKEKKFKSVWVLGSNSKVAQSICIELAKKGCKELFLISRDKDQSLNFAEFLKNNYEVKVTIKIIDIKDKEFYNNQNNFKVGDFDLYLITAGYLGNNENAKIDLQETKNIIFNNYFGIIPWINAIATADRIEKKCSLWVFTSVAADRGRPSNYYYGSAKAGLQNFCEGLLASCYGKPFCVRIIKAGFIATPLTLSIAPKSLCIKTSKVAKILLKKPHRRGVEYLPWFWGPIMFFIRKIPIKLVSKL